MIGLRDFHKTYKGASFGYRLRELRWQLRYAWQRAWRGYSDVDVFDFSKDIPLKMQNADFAVSRAGASTLWELCANCLPTFFIPFKYAAADHQYFNAKALKDKNLCFLQREEELDEKYFFEAINSNINKMSIDLKDSIKPDAILLIVNKILED